MKQIRQKLNGQTGASMVLALLFLFFCLTVGAVVLTAASANSGRLSRIRQEQQNYLAVESAALLLRDDLADLHLEGSYQYQRIDWTSVYYEELEDGSMREYYSSGSSDAYYQGAVTLEGTALTALAQLKQDFTALFYSKTEAKLGVTPPASMRYVLELDPGEADGIALPTVQAVLTVGTDTTDTAVLYDITAVLSLKEDGSSPMTLYFSPIAYPVTTEDTSDTQVSGGGGEYDSSTTTTTRTITHHYAYDWNAPAVSKGVGQ